jgi:methylated-DNA-protein-cysteine methyltransferase-like protein
MVKAKGESAWGEVFAIVERIPRGRVMNYGQIARLLERPLSARAVGWALHQCPDGLPWHRVVNASGGCSTDKLGAHPGLQRAMLEAEGVKFRPSSTLDMDKYRWWPSERHRKKK